MGLDIDKQVIEATTKCEKGFACLSSTDRVYCQVEECLFGKIHFIKCLHKEPCPYQSQLEGFCVCTCPTRKEIYNKYGI